MRTVSTDPISNPSPPAGQAPQAAPAPQAAQATQAQATQATKDASPHAEFRPYRRFVSWFILTFVLLGGSYLLLSVAVTIYRRQHAVLLGSPVGTLATRQDAESCYDELSDVVEGLLKYLESSPTLMAHTDPTDVQKWAEAGSYWRGQWKAAGERCGFERRRGAKNWDEMAVLHEELRETEATYTKEISRFGNVLAPRVGRLRERLARIGHRLSLPQSERAD